MRILTIIFSLIVNFAFGQDKKISINQNIVKYEITDEFNRFNDLFKIHSKYESLVIAIEGNVLKIENKFSNGFTGHNISFKINKNLSLISYKYDNWTDVVGLDRNYIIKKITFKLNQNPFQNLKGIRGCYILNIDLVASSGKVLKSEIFKGKFKSYKGIDKNSEEYKWALEDNKIFYGITNENGIYLRPDKMPSLKSDDKILINEIKKIEGYIPKKLRAYVVINEKGEIENEPFGFLGDFGHLDKEIKKQIKQLLIELTDWYPACVNDLEVKSQIPIVIGIE